MAARSIDSMLSCPAPLDHGDIVELAHGGGGRKTAKLDRDALRAGLQEPVPRAARRRRRGHDRQRAPGLHHGHLRREARLLPGRRHRLARRARHGQRPRDVRGRAALPERGLPARGGLPDARPRARRGLDGRGLREGRGLAGDGGHEGRGPRQGRRHLREHLRRGPGARGCRRRAEARRGGRRRARVGPGRRSRDRRDGGARGHRLRDRRSSPTARPSCVRCSLCSMRSATRTCCATPRAGDWRRRSARSRSPRTSGSGSRKRRSRCGRRCAAPASCWASIRSTSRARAASWRSCPGRRRTRRSRPSAPSPGGEAARRIGSVVADDPGRLVLRTRIGSHRLLERLSGEQLPRIC